MGKNKVLVLCVAWVSILAVGTLAYVSFVPSKKQDDRSSVEPKTPEPSVPSKKQDDRSPVEPKPPEPSPSPGQHTKANVSPPMEVPFILWGGDVATFLANGGLETRPGTIFQRLDLNLKLVPGDDFEGQVKKYLAGQTPFLRGTLSMLGQASEVINASANTRAVVFLQLTWSSGDHMVARKNCNTLADLKGKKVALQKGGPHVGMLADVLWTAGLSWSDIQPIWVSDVTGDKGPAALFRKDSTVDACFAVSPDMVALTGGLEGVGTGDKQTVRGAHVLVSTAQMSRSIADVYACRKDFYDTHREFIEKFAAGYLKACEELLTLKKAFDRGESSPKYREVLTLAQQIFGKEVLPTEDDAHGLICDCSFVGLPGNRSFFTDPGNPSGFEVRQSDALDLAVVLEGAKTKTDFIKPALDYDRLKQSASRAQTPGLRHRLRPAPVAGKPVTQSSHLPSTLMPTKPFLIQRNMGRTSAA